MKNEIRIELEKYKSILFYLLLMRFHILKNLFI